MHLVHKHKNLKHLEQIVGEIGLKNTLLLLATLSQEASTVEDEFAQEDEKRSPFHRATHHIMIASMYSPTESFFCSTIHGDIKLSDRLCPEGEKIFLDFT